MGRLSAKVSQGMRANQSSANERAFMPGDYSRRKTTGKPEAWAKRAGWADRRGSFVMSWPGSWRKESLIAHPPGAGGGPRGIRTVVGADTKVMGGIRINMQLSRNARPLKGEVHEHTVLRRADDVVVAMHQE